MFDDEVAVLRECMARRGHSVDHAWQLAGALVELLWWRDEFVEAANVAEKTLGDLAGDFDLIEGQMVPYDDALIAGSALSGKDAVAVVKRVRSRVFSDSVVAKRLDFLAQNLPGRPSHELLSGFQWRNDVRPLRRRDQELVDRGVDRLDSDEVDQLWHAAHSRRKWSLARALLDAGHGPNRWYVAAWVAGCLVDEGAPERAGELLTAAVDDWIPYMPFDLVPTDVVLQPKLRPAITPELRERVAARVDISQVPGVQL